MVKKSMTFNGPHNDSILIIGLANNKVIPFSFNTEQGDLDQIEK
jgi:hypothetical protein